MDNNGWKLVEAQINSLKEKISNIGLQAQIGEACEKKTEQLNHNIDPGKRWKKRHKFWGHSILELGVGALAIGWLIVSAVVLIVALSARF